MIIRTKRFILRPYRKGDEESLQKNINDKEVYKYTLRIPYPYKLKDAKWWINYNFRLEKKKNPNEINFAVVINGKVVGGIGLMNKESNHKAEIGYWIGR